MSASKGECGPSAVARTFRAAAAYATLLLFPRPIDYAPQPDLLRPRLRRSHRVSLPPWRSVALGQLRQRIRRVLFSGGTSLRGEPGAPRVRWPPPRLERGRAARADRVAPSR